MLTPAELLRIKSLDEAEYLWREGRISDRDLHRYRFAWTWCTFRWSGEADRAQERVYQRSGRAGLDRAVARVRRVVGLPV